MAGEIITAKTYLKYCVETSAGTRPTTGYTSLPGVKSIPDINPAPSQEEVTDLSDWPYRRYTEGLKDLGSENSFTFNHTSVFTEAWDSLISEYETAHAAGLAVWFEVANENDPESCFFPGIPSARGLSARTVGAVWEDTVYVTISGSPVFANASA